MSRILPFLLLALLLYPFAEIGASIWLYHQIGGWLFIWFIGAAWLGMTILRNWRAAAGWAILSAARAGELPFSRLFYALRTMVAAVLFIIPGPIGDLIGILLMLPWPGTRAMAAPAAPVEDDVLEGEFTEIKPETRRIDEPR